MIRLVIMTKINNVVHDMILDMIVNHRNHPNHPNHHEKSWETIRDHHKSWIIIHLWNDLGLWIWRPGAKDHLPSERGETAGQRMGQLRRGDIQITAELWLLIIDENSDFFCGHLELSDYFSSNASNWCPLFEDGVLNASSWVFWTDSNHFEYFLKHDMQMIHWIGLRNPFKNYYPPVSMILDLMRKT